MLPWEPEFRSDLAQNLMQPFPVPMMLQIKFGPLVAEIFMFESVNRWKDGCRLDGYSISSTCEPLTQVS